MDQEIQVVLEKNENLEWSGKMNRVAVNVNLIIGVIIVVAIAIGLRFFAEDGVIKFTQENSDTITLSLSLVRGLVLLFGLLISLWTYISSLITRYALTNKRLLIKSGIIGRDFKSIYFEQVRNTNVSVGLVDKILGVGTINFDTGEIETVRGAGSYPSGVQTKYTAMKHISTPYEVYKIVQSKLSQRKESLYSGRADLGNVQRD